MHGLDLGWVQGAGRQRLAGSAQQD